MDKKAYFYLIKEAGHGGNAFWAPEIFNMIDAFIKENIVN